MAFPNDEEYLQTVGTHKPGSIVRIELKNFLTHGHAVIQPGPRLNVVVGANGTGKSTILNAICLGLGGDPKLLGRADDLREFIMHDEDTAEIEIQLQNHPNKTNHVIRRVIDRNKGSERGRGRGASVFYVNDEKTTIQDVRSIVSGEYGISIDNLCTFLPQDKVGNFSGFTDQNRLLETEKTLSKCGRYYELHQNLISAEAEMENSSCDVDTIQDNLNKLQVEFGRLEREKELAEEREQALKQIELLNMKKLWIEFEYLREEALKIKEEKDRIKVEIKTEREKIAPFEKQFEMMLSSKKEMEAKHKAVDQETQKLMMEIEKQETKFDNHDDEIEVIVANLSEIDAKKTRLEAQVKEHKTRLQQVEEEWNALPPKEQTEATHSEAVQRMKDVKRDSEAAKREDRTLKAKFQELEEKAKNMQGKLARMNDDAARRREKIFREKKNLGTIYNWLSSNRSNFRRPVFGPIAAEITTDSEHTSAYLEFHVSNQVLHSFVVETREDYNRLYESVRNELQVPINILLVARTKEVSRMYSTEKMEILKREHGVSSYLDETFTAPESVLQALRDYGNVDRVLVGGEKTQYSIDHDELLDYLSQPERNVGQQNPMSSCIFAAKGNQFFRYTQTVSKYSREIGSRVDQVGQAKLLGKGVNPEVRKIAEDELAAVHVEISELRPNTIKSEKIVSDFESELQNLNLKAKGTKQALEIYAKLEDKLRRQRDKVKEAVSEFEKDETKEKKEHIKCLMNRLSHAITAIEAHAGHHRGIIKLTIASAAFTVNKTMLATAERNARIELNEMKRTFKELNDTALQIQQQFQECKQKVSSKKREADAVAPLVDSEGNDLPLKSQLSELDVSDLNELDAAIEEIERSIEGIHENPDALRHYEKVKTEIERVTAQLEENRNSRETRFTNIQNLRGPWESALDTYMQKINTLFTHYMAEMGCTGEVRLKKSVTGEGENEKGNFKDWGIEILVSFREGAKAQVLSAERHSGGERSVSTILYLMALQDLMVAPFRCVDEINQGLDDRNERLVFKRIVENSTRKPKAGLTDHSGQYFLITPKLLPNLTDMEEQAVTILFVYNGAYNFKNPLDCNFQSPTILGMEASHSEDIDLDNEVPKKKAKRGKR